MNIQSKHGTHKGRAFTKRSKAYVDSRREAITELLEKEGQASVLELADHFEVSSLTIRRDGLS